MIVNIINSIMLIVLGVLGASALIIKNKPEAKNIIDKLVPIQGILGLIGVLLGLISVFHSFGYIEYMKCGFVFVLGFIITLVAGLLIIALGAMYGFGFIKSKALNNVENEGVAKAEEFIKKITSVQIPLGIAAAVMGLVLLIFTVTSNDAMTNSLVECMMKYGMDILKP